MQKLEEEKRRLIEERENHKQEMEKMKFEIACIKVKAHLELKRDRRIGEVNMKEKQLLSMITHSSRSK